MYNVSLFTVKLFSVWIVGNNMILFEALIFLEVKTYIYSAYYSEK